MKKAAKPEAPVQPEAVVAPVIRRDPMKWVGLDLGSGVEYVAAPGRQRVVEAVGQRWEHVGEDGDGVWLYRVTA
jgi:hypothetical protein